MKGIRQTGLYRQFGYFWIPEIQSALFECGTRCKTSYIIVIFYYHILILYFIIVYVYCCHLAYSLDKISECQKTRVENTLLHYS